MKREVDVVIVGAGMAGLALACALRDSGLHIILLEANKLPSLSPGPLSGGVSAYDPRVSALSAGSVDFLEGLGVWESICAARCAEFQHMQVWDGCGTAGIDFHAAELGVSALGYIVENSLTQTALFAQLQQSTGLQVICPGKICAMRTSCDEGRTQQVDLADGTTLHAQLIVAADGARSQMRELAGFKMREWSYQQSAIVATVETAEPHGNTARQRFLPQGPLAFLPLAHESQRYCSIVWSADTEIAEQIMRLDDSEFCTQLAHAFESRLGEITNCSQRFCFPLQQRHAVDYVKPGLALIGDAAHVIHPLAGQGVNLGFKDVRVLAEEIQRAHSGNVAIGSELFLKRYQRRRKLDNLAMMAAVDGFKHLFGSRALPLVWLRNAGMRQLAGIGPLKQQIVRHAMGI